jgi:hypothetical protein
MALDDHTEVRVLKEYPKGAAAEQAIRALILLTEKRG